MFLSTPISTLVNACIIIFGTLICATAIYLILQVINSRFRSEEINQRLQVFWMISLVFMLSMSAGAISVILLFLYLSFLALREFSSIVSLGKSDLGLRSAVFIILFGHYCAIVFGFKITFIISPILLIVSVLLFYALKKKDISAKIASVWLFGVLATVFLLSFSTLFAMESFTQNAMDGVGLIIYLVFLTELNDVFQFVWGKAFGRRKIVPRISPNKTLEGFVGGLFSTVIVATLICGSLTSLSILSAAISGVVIAVSGFVGDVAFSYIKRLHNKKESGDLLPGHGGILDRVDSICFSSVAFIIFISTNSLF
ncbi:MAG: hypothetical protein COA79_05555 [Planctomycetota bacterium]|nr:MAG: hypothetical protein COA79_05555 [Planctomycetota bacterium]